MVPRPRSQVLYVMTSSPLRTPWLLLVALTLLLAASAPAATLQLSGPVGAQVRLADRDLGLLPLAEPISLEPGVYTIECRAKGYKKLDQVVVISEPDVWLHVHLRPVLLERKHVVTGSVLYAGLGQWYMGARVRGWVYFLGETGGLLTALAGELQMKNAKDDYTNYQAAYESAVLQSEINFYREKSSKAYSDIEEMEKLRSTGLYVAVGSWALSILDAVILFPNVDVGPGTVPPSTVGMSVPPTSGIHAAVTLGF